MSEKVIPEGNFAVPQGLRPLPNDKIEVDTADNKIRFNGKKCVAGK